MEKTNNGSNGTILIDMLNGLEGLNGFVDAFDKAIYYNDACDEFQYKNRDGIITITAISEGQVSCQFVANLKYNTICSLEINNSLVRGLK